MGADLYDYDSLSRLAGVSVTDSADADHDLGYVYDEFGNTVELHHRVEYPDGSVTNAATLQPVNPFTNRLDDMAYDTAGNQLHYGTSALAWDPLNRLSYRGTYIDFPESFGYDVGGDRIVTFVRGRVPAAKYTLRDIEGRPIREFQDGFFAGLHWTRDHLFLGRQAIASEAPSYGGLRHHHRDHLGTLRLTTDADKVVQDEFRLFPFGEPMEGGTGEPLKFTGHERDDFDSFGGLDYMHARYYSAHFRRFLSVDPISGTPGDPQSWNKYAYVLNNPLRYVDPLGLMTCDWGPDGFSCSDEILVTGQLVCDELVGCTLNEEVKQNFAAIDRYKGDQPRVEPFSGGSAFTAAVLTEFSAGLNRPVDFVNDVFDPFAHYSAGFGDALLLGAGPVLRGWMGNTVIDQGSGYYKAGTVSTFALGLGRVAYAGLAKGGSVLAGSGMQASAFRESLKRVFRLGLFPSWRTPNLSRYTTDAALRAAAGHTNPGVNAYGIGIMFSGGYLSW